MRARPPRQPAGRAPSERPATFSRPRNPPTSPPLARPPSPAWRTWPGPQWCSGARAPSSPPGGGRARPVDQHLDGSGHGTSITMRSPSATKAMGPPSTASGATWPMQNPWVPPENRPSVSRAQSPPRPAPFMAPGHRQHLPHAGPPFGSLVADHQDRPGLDPTPARMASMAVSSPSNTRAGPSKRSTSRPATFTTAPSGASEPRRMAIPPPAWMGRRAGG